MKNSISLLLLFLVVSCSSPEKKSPQDGWQWLFHNNNLSAWDTYLGPQFLQDTTSTHDDSKPVYGLNNDPLKVFSIAELDGKKVIRISGQILGGLSTKEEFEDYHLQLQFRWGEMKWFPRKRDSDKRDSGLLYHSMGDHSADGGYWMRSHEFQIQQGDCGDYWGVAGGTSSIRASLNTDSVYQYNPKAGVVIFSAQSDAGRYCKKYPDAEKARGEWNTLDLYCLGDSSAHVVNGEVTMILHRLSQTDSSGTTPLTGGKIQLQSEAAEIFYKDVRIQPIGQDGWLK